MEPRSAALTLQFAGRLRATNDHVYVFVFISLRFFSVGAS